MVKFATLLSFAAIGVNANINAWYNVRKSEVTTCKGISGTYQFVETVNEYDNSVVGTLGEVGAERCSGGVGYLLIENDCSWTYKKVKTDPDRFCEADEGYGGQSIVGVQQEFWAIDFNYADSSSTVSKWIKEFIFTIEKVPGLLGGEARRFNGVVQRVNGCDLSVEGWHVELADVKPCVTGFNLGQYRDANVAKRHARLTTSSSSSVDVSDIKDALALIANAIPSTFDEATTTSSSSSSNDAPACSELAGVYQIVETVNEYDASEVGSSENGDARCNGGLAYLDIHADCSWAYKKVKVGRHVPRYNVPLYECQDDAGWEATGVVEHEGEFCRISRVEEDNRDLDFVFAVNPLAGSGSSRPMVIQGILEKDDETYLPAQRRRGCDIAFSGWRTARPDLVPCRDRCYGTLNGQFEDGYNNFGSDFEAVTGPERELVLGSAGLNEFSITVQANVLNALFSRYESTGYGLVGASNAVVAGPHTIWRERYERLNEKACCGSSTYQLSFKALFVGQGAAGSVSVVAGPAQSPLQVANKHPFNFAATQQLTGDWVMYQSEYFNSLLDNLYVEIQYTRGNLGTALGEVDGFVIDDVQIRCVGTQDTAVTVA